MSIEWPALDGWGQETIPFPLPFAPGLLYSGVEELRFMRGWARPGEPDHWSYVFVWRLESSPAVSESSLVADLRDYYAGLCKAVAGDSVEHDADAYQARIQAAGVWIREGHEVRRFEGAADLKDSFGDGRPLTLQLRLETWECEDTGATLVLIQASPSSDEAVWRQLAAQALELTCH